ncbi:hypothetical protein ABIB62_003501 [Mucilaginibacter sp. UYP25]|uniref:hypothetical protein n=1 Tax=unclassified Mucilaginibacter TaxID=2617802 RepID=UPI0033946278
MSIDKENTDKNKDLKVKRKRTTNPPINDGMNTPVPDSTVIPIISKSGEALYKQAENPLGDPHKI